MGTIDLKTLAVDSQYRDGSQYIEVDSVMHIGNSKMAETTNKYNVKNININKSSKDLNYCNIFIYGNTIIIPDIYKLDDEDITDLLYHLKHCKNFNTIIVLKAWEEQGNYNHLLKFITRYKLCKKGELAHTRLIISANKLPEYCIEDIVRKDIRCYNFNFPDKSLELSFKFKSWNHRYYNCIINIFETGAGNLGLFLRFSKENERSRSIIARCMKAAANFLMESNKYIKEDQ